MITKKLQNINLGIFNTIITESLSTFITYRLPATETLIGSFLFSLGGQRKFVMCFQGYQLHLGQNS